MLDMAPEQECMREIFLVMRWEKGGFAIPLSQLELIHAKDKFGEEGCGSEFR